MTAAAEELWVLCLLQVVYFHGAGVVLQGCAAEFLQDLQCLLIALCDKVGFCQPVGYFRLLGP